MFWKILFAPIALPMMAIRAITKGRRDEDPWTAARERMAAGKVNTPPDKPKYATWLKAYHRRVSDDLRFEIEYQDRDGVVSTRISAPSIIHTANDVLYIQAFCEGRQDIRTFRSDNIRKCRNLTDNRLVEDLGDYLRRKY